MYRQLHVSNHRVSPCEPYKEPEDLGTAQTDLP